MTVPYIFQNASSPIPLSQLDANFASTSNSSGVTYTPSGTGAVAQTVQQKLREYVSVFDYMTTTQIASVQARDLTQDVSTAIENAINANPHSTVFFPAGEYLITRQLAITVYTYSIEGERNERGQNSYAYDSGRYSSVTFNFQPTDPTAFLVNIYEATSGPDIIGPFCHSYILFILNGANGFQFGNESLPISDAGGQAYIHGARFTGCNFQNTGTAFDSTTNGVMTFTGTRAIGLCKAFESVIEDVSIIGGDYGIRTYGCDKFNSTRTRIYCMRPYDFVRVSSFGQQHTIYDFETEGWAISPIRNNGVSLSVTAASFEANIGTPVGAGKYVLPTCTATVTANSATLTFSRTMDNILIPGWSVITLTDGTNTDTCFVTAVSGTSVTVDTSYFRFTWSGTATTITRIHNFGPLHCPSSSNSNYTSIEPGAYLNCPSFVYVANEGQMNLCNVGAPFGAFGDISALAVGNMYGGQYNMNGQLVMTNCNYIIYGDNVNHPLIRLVNANEQYGTISNANNRLGSADVFHAYNKAYRKWIYTPATYCTNANNNQTLTYKLVSGDTNTSQQCWAYYLDSTQPASTRIFWVYDDTLPSATLGSIKIVVRARAKTGTANLSLVVGSSGGGATVATFALTTTWQVFEYINSGIIGLWGPSYTGRIFELGSDADCYIESAMVLDENPNTPFNYAVNSVAKNIGHNQKTLTTGVSTLIATAVGTYYSSYKVKCYGSVIDGSGLYAPVYAEYLVQETNFGGVLDVRGVSLIYKQAQSINAGIYTSDIAITATATSGIVSIFATFTKTGSGSGTTGIFSFEIEAMGYSQSNITPA